MSTMQTTPFQSTYQPWTPTAGGFTVTEEYVGRHRKVDARRAGFFRTMFYLGRHRRRH